MPQVVQSCARWHVPKLQAADLRREPSEPYTEVVTANPPFGCALCMLRSGR